MFSNIYIILLFQQNWGISFLILLPDWEKTRKCISLCFFKIELNPLSRRRRRVKPAQKASSSLAMVFEANGMTFLGTLQIKFDSSGKGRTRASPLLPLKQTNIIVLLQIWIQPIVMEKKACEASSKSQQFLGYGTGGEWNDLARF